MKKYGLHPLQAAEGLLLALLWVLICVGGTAYLLLHPGAASESEHQDFFLAGILLCVAGVCLVKRCLHLLRFRVEYDEFSLRFHFSDGEERVLSWHELPRKVRFEKERTGWRLTFPDGKTFPLHQSARGFRALAGTLREKGVLP